MSYTLTVTKKPSHLHFFITGDLNEENVLRYFNEILNACSTHKCFRILVEESLDGPRLNAVRVIEMIERAAGKSRGILKAIAYVDVNVQNNSMKFIEDAAINRGLPIKVFSSVTNAEKWLSDSDR